MTVPSTTSLTTSHWVADGSGPALRLDLTVGQLLRDVATAVPDRTALIEGTVDPASRRRWTYAQLLTDAERCARTLLRRFRPGERIAVWAPNSAEWLIVEYGAALAGLTLVTVNPSLQPAELAYVLTQSEASGILLVPDARGNPLTAHLEQVRAGLPDAPRGAPTRPAPRPAARGRPGGPAADIELPDVTGDDIVQIQYTSGTTGFPKGAMLRHAGVVNNATCWADRLGVPDGEPWLSPCPCSTPAGACSPPSAPSRRAPLVVMPGFDPGTAARSRRDRTALVPRRRPDDAPRRRGPPRRRHP